MLAAPIRAYWSIAAIPCRTFAVASPSISFSAEGD
jgi:hypothetical protein